jgi:hypothetical protein
MTKGGSSGAFMADGERKGGGAGDLAWKATCGERGSGKARPVTRGVAPSIQRPGRIGHVDGAVQCGTLEGEGGRPVKSGGTVPIGTGQTVFKPFQISLNRFKQT